MAACADGGRERPEPVPDGVVLVEMYRDVRDHGGDLAADEACPDCGGPVYACKPGLVPDDVAERVEYQCLACGEPVYEPVECVACGETVREGGVDRDGDPICGDCYWDGVWRPPDGSPRVGGPEPCEDCYRGAATDGVNVARRRTWSTYPQDIRRVERRPMYCDECWAWRQERAPLKPTADEIRERRREVRA